jgi:long-chain acyl-CoA synthetase
MAITPPPRGANPFDDTGVRPDADGIRRYPDLHESLVEMLGDSVRADPQAEALVEVGGERISYAQLWDRAARVGGGLRAAGISPGDRVAIRLPNSIDWVVAFFGGLMAGAVVVPVNTRLAEPESAYIIGDSGSSYVFEPGAALPDGAPLVHEGDPQDRHRGDLLYQRHHRVPQGRHAHARERARERGDRLPGERYPPGCGP